MEHRELPSFGAASWTEREVAGAKPKGMYHDAPSATVCRALHLNCMKRLGCDASRRERQRGAMLDSVCQDLGYPPTVQRFAWFYYSKIRRAEHVQNSHKLLAATLYAAAREIHTCMSLRSIIDSFDRQGIPVTVRDAARAYSRFRRYLPHANVPPERYLFKIMADLAPSRRVKNALAKAGRDVDEVFVSVVQRAKHTIHSCKALAGVASIKAAAAIYLAFKQCGVPIAAVAVAELVDATEGNLRNVAAALARSKTCKAVMHARPLWPRGN
jgi:transcription initiation factor TFIIIB Brf1 subunit/transcription initiation factor TFIIB